LALAAALLVLQQQKAIMELLVQLQALVQFLLLAVAVVQVIVLLTKQQVLVVRAVVVLGRIRLVAQGQQMKGLQAVQDQPLVVVVLVLQVVLALIVHHTQVELAEMVWLHQSQAVR
jgi:hypothetical protein